MSTVIIIPRTIGPVSISAFLYEQHRSSAAVTDNAIEDGSSINDHMYTKPKELTLDIVDERGSDAFISLVEQQALREPFEIQTGLAIYENVVIVDIVADREKSTSRILRATIELKEVRIVATQTQFASNFEDLPPTIGPSLEPKVVDQTAPSVERGDAQTNEVDSNESSSILADVFL